MAEIQKTYFNVNLNDYIKVRLTELGIKVYQESFTKYGLPLPKITIDDEGYTLFQLHYFIHTFGNYLGVGSELPCDTNVQIQYFKEKQDK